MLNKNIFTKYQEALIYLQTQFNALYIAHSKLGEENPIEHLKFRIKTEESIKEKLNRLKERTPDRNEASKYNLSEESLNNNLNDIVGVRIVCPFLSDVERVIQIIHKTKEDMGIEIIEEKDYISHPKTNGYSSYHMKIVASIPINSTIEKVKAEIQIRTITMDMLNSLEHKISYKKGIELPEEMQQKLNQITRYCNLIDTKLVRILTEERKKQKPNISSISIPQFMNTKEFDAFLSNYQMGLDILNEKINQLSLDYYANQENNPIEHVKSRIKFKERIVHKLERKHLPITMQNIENYINDIAGLRIVCSFKSDVEEMIRSIKETISHNNSLFEIIEEQDYNQHPKPNGYTSYHLLIKVPVYNHNKINFVKVEIQIRTHTQEMWSILQERLCYQKETSREIEDNLKEMSKVLLDIDNSMNEMIKESILLQKENYKKRTRNKKK